MSQEVKEPSKLNKLKNRRSIFKGAHLNFHNTSRANKSVIIQFPVVETDEHLYSLPRKLNEDEIIRKPFFRGLKSATKAIDESRKRNEPDCTNMLGLDIRKVNWHTQNKKDWEHPTPLNRLARYSCNSQVGTISKRCSPRVKKIANTFLIRNNTQQTLEGQQSESLSPSGKLEFVQSALFHSSDNRNMAPSVPCKAKYLYEKLAIKPMAVKRDSNNLVYQKRIKSYIDLLWKVSFAHNIFADLSLANEEAFKVKKYKAYVGPGNNGSMIKSLIKRRFWWTIVEDKTCEDLNFIWTQIKITSLFEQQPQSLRKKPEYLPQDQGGEQIKDKSKTSIKFKRGSFQEQRRQMQRSELFNFKLLIDKDCQVYRKYYKKYERQKDRAFEFRQENIKKKLHSHIPMQLTMHNHLENNFYLGNKKALFHNLKEYCQLTSQNLYQYIPLTFHIKKGIKDPQYKRFVSFYQRRKSLMKKEQAEQEQLSSAKRRKTRNIWIVKPGQNSNRGRGITVIDEIYELNQIMKQTQKEREKTYIVQMYIDRPFLYHGRKFDIRHYMLLTNLHGVMRAYWYQEGYIRTSSYDFHIDSFEPQIHLTNDAIQKAYPNYGRYQPCNKLSYAQFQRYLDTYYKQKRFNFAKSILSRMKKMATDAARSVYTKISPKNQMHNFQIFGFDFMIDKSFKPSLIEINTNPCLEVNCPLLDRIIPYMVQQSLKLSLDVINPPPCHYPKNQKHLTPMVDLQSFKFQLIFDSQVEGEQLTNIYKKAKGNLIDEIGQISEDETFKDDGKQIKLDEFS